MQTLICHLASVIAYSRSSRPRFGAWAGVLAGTLTACAFAPSRGAAQVVPLQDIIPLDQLEIRAGDVIDLATSQADAVRELKTAQLSMKTLQMLQPSAAVTGLEMQIAQLNVQAAESKVRILHAVAEAQLATARSKLEILQRLGNGQNPDVTNPLIRQAEAMVRILQMIIAISAEPVQQYGR